MIFTQERFYFIFRVVFTRERFYFTLRVIFTQECFYITFRVVSQGGCYKIITAKCNWNFMWMCSPCVVLYAEQDCSGPGRQTEGDRWMRIKSLHFTSLQQVEGAVSKSCSKGADPNTDAKKAAVASWWSILTHFSQHMSRRIISLLWKHGVTSQQCSFDVKLKWF